ncbi:BON domain-containing protein [Pseudoxanthomonas winnipegensis]|uniref:BON domain-containing protein n=1 Tax=Pseudoxanthomonas winnipegensis TaxID=2480810 RepID=UPI0025769DDA|nr:BON domain-containing protein [Pseudoxanthomonas winnipegensis]WJI14332.1 BON domain-containing protein [Pseudoxanthomonas winnipegensis]
MSTPARSDQLIGDDVVRTLAQQPDIEAGEILVEIRDGQVTLTGNVPERDMKQRAVAYVRQIDGVVGVRDLIRYDDGSASFGPPGQAVRDGDHEGGPGSAAEADLREDG